MSAFGINALNPHDYEHIFGFAVARAAADASLAEIWNGPTVTDQRYRFGVSTFAFTAPNSVSPTGHITAYAATPNWIGRRAAGVRAAPTAVQSGQTLAQFGGAGYGATGFSTTARGAIEVVAQENWTDAAHGTYLSFQTTPIGSTSRVQVATLDAAGQLALGTAGVTGGVTIGGDTNLYRGSAGLLRTDSSFHVDGNFTLTGTALVTGVATFSDRILASGGVVINGGTTAEGALLIAASAGLVIRGRTGSSFDLLLQNAGSSSVLGITTGTQDIVLGGGLTAPGSIYFANLPTADPAIAGALWRDGTTVKVSV